MPSLSVPYASVFWEIGGIDMHWYRVPLWSTVHASGTSNPGTLFLATYIFRQSNAATLAHYSSSIRIPFTIHPLHLLIKMPPAVYLSPPWPPSVYNSSVDGYLALRTCTTYWLATQKSLSSLAKRLSTPINSWKRSSLPGASWILASSAFSSAVKSA